MSESLSQPHLCVIVGSTRPRRAGESIADWVAERARLRDDYDVDIVDLRELNLPLLNEPEMASTSTYAHEATKQWSAIVRRADAFVFVVPEYNHSFSAAVKNALDFLYHEWAHRPVGVVCYGAGARGARAAVALRPVFAALRMPWAGEVAIGLREHPLSEGHFHGNEELEAGVTRVLDELSTLEEIYRPRRLRD